MKQEQPKPGWMNHAAVVPFEWGDKSGFAIARHRNRLKAYDVVTKTATWVRDPNIVYVFPTQDEAQRTLDALSKAVAL